MILRYCIAGLFGVLLGVASAQAARLGNLFEAEVGAAGRDAESRDAALQGALQQVLVRIIGISGSDQQATAGALLQKPGRFVEQYLFRDTDAGQLRLWAKFDGVTLAREVRRLGLPYWGPDRPDTLLWLAVDNRSQRFLVADTDSATATAVRQAATAYGLPVTLPLMDLQDQRDVDFTDIWGGFLGPVESASRRYRPQVVLVSKVGRAGASGWKGDWTLIAAGSSHRWSAHAATLNAAVEGGIATAVEWLAVRYAVVASGQSVRTLVVEGIRGLDDYGRVYQYLASLTPVEQVQVTRVSDQEITFDLQLSAQEHTLLRLITLGRTLRAVEDPESWRFRVSP